MYSIRTLCAAAPEHCANILSVILPQYPPRLFSFIAQYVYVTIPATMYIALVDPILPSSIHILPSSIHILPSSIHILPWSILHYLRVPDILLNLLHLYTCIPHSYIQMSTTEYSTYVYMICIHMQ